MSGHQLKLPTTSYNGVISAIWRHLVFVIRGYRGVTAKVYAIRIANISGRRGVVGFITQVCMAVVRVQRQILAQVVYAVLQRSQPAL